MFSFSSYLFCKNEIFHFTTMKTTLKEFESLWIRIFCILLSSACYLSVANHHLYSTTLVYQLYWKLNMRISLVKVFYSFLSRFSVVLQFLKVGLSPSKKKLFYLPHWKPFKNHEKYFLFHLKSSFHSLCHDFLVI